MATYIVETVTIDQPTQHREIAVTAATSDEAMRNARIDHYATFGWGPEAVARIVDAIEAPVTGERRDITWASINDDPPNGWEP